MNKWKEIAQLIPVFNKTFNELIDFEKFNMIAMTFHSTAIEGSTLTLSESEVLLDKGLTPKGKPIIHQNMVLDHYQAITMVLKMAEDKVKVSVPMVQSVAAAVMKNTGTKYSTPLGEYDVSKGELRLNNVRAGAQYFVNYDKVKGLLEKLVNETQHRITQVNTVEDTLKLSFNVHFDLVSIHPFGDGNGRTSRLMMNFVQYYHNLPIAPVFVEDRQEYIESLMAATKINSMEPFYDFMTGQYLKHLRNEIEKFQNAQSEKGRMLSFIF